MSTADKPRHLSNLALKTLDIVRLAARRGRMDMTLVEILHALRSAEPGKTFEKSSLSRELTHLALDGLLLRRSIKRKSAWEALPKGMDQQGSPSSFAYYAPGTAGTGRRVDVAPAAPAAAPAPVASADFY